MNNKVQFNLRQLLSVSTVFLLAPALRLIPSATADLARRAAWLTVPVALPLVFLYMFFLRCFLTARKENEGLGHLILRSLGKPAGTVFLFFFALWYLIYGGFMLRSGALRIITAIYPHSSPAFFIISMGLVCLCAALGSERTLVRTARIIQPFLLGMLLLVLLFSLFSVEKENLLPLTVFDCANCFKGSLASLGVCSISIYSCLFLNDLSLERKGTLRSLFIWAFFILSLLFCLVTAIQGSFGYELTAKLSQPFFSLVRNLVFFRSLERTEALVVSLWIFSDFILVSLCLYISQHLLRLLFGFDSAYRGQQTFDLSKGRWIIWLCSFILMFLACVVAPDPASMTLWSRQIIPGINFLISLFLLPLIYLIGKVRKVL